jgi:hypothetical protein
MFSGARAAQETAEAPQRAINPINHEGDRDAGAKNIVQQESVNKNFNVLPIPLFFRRI